MAGELGHSRSVSLHVIPFLLLLLLSLVYSVVVVVKLLLQQLVYIIIIIVNVLCYSDFVLFPWVSLLGTALHEENISTHFFGHIKVSFLGGFS